MPRVGGPSNPRRSGAARRLRWPHAALAARGAGRTRRWPHAALADAALAEAAPTDAVAMHAVNCPSPPLQLDMGRTTDGRRLVEVTADASVHAALRPAAVALHAPFPRPRPLPPPPPPAPPPPAADDHLSGGAP
jgi:hypothetical protein